MLEQNQVTLELSGKQDGEQKAKPASAEARENTFTLTRCQKMRILCGYESILFLFIFLGIAGLSLFLFSVYSSSWKWVYFALATLSCLVSIRFLAITFSAVFSTEKKEE